MELLVGALPEAEVSNRIDDDVVTTVFLMLTRLISPFVAPQRLSTSPRITSLLDCFRRLLHLRLQYQPWP